MNKAILMVFTLILFALLIAGCEVSAEQHNALIAERNALAVERNTLEIEPKNIQDVKKVFIKGMGVSVACAGNSQVEPTPADTFRAEEDITIIGFEIDIDNWGAKLIGNDGVAVVWAELTPKAKMYQDGSLGGVCGTQTWQTGFSADFKPSRVVVMFPAGYGVTMKEGGIINLLYSMTNGSSGEVGFRLAAFIYYIKGTR